MQRPARMSFAAMVTAFVLASPLIPSYAADPVPEVTPAPDIRIGTYNIQAGRSVAEFRAGVEALAPRTDLMGLQEVASKEKEQVLAALAPSGWSYYRERPASQTPVLWRNDRFSFVGARVAQISAGRYIGYEVPGRDPYQPAKYISVVRLVDNLTGGQVSLVNVHLLPGAVIAGHRYPGRPRRFQLYVDGLHKLAEITASELAWGQVFVFGDLNAGYVPDARLQRWRLPYRTFQRLGMRSMWATERPSDGRGTLKTALIDQVYSRLPATSARVQFDIKNSDHRPAIATYTLG